MFVLKGSLKTTRVICYMLYKTTELGDYVVSMKCTVVDRSLLWFGFVGGMIHLPFSRWV